MIHACMTNSGKELSLCMEGHAGYAERGNDIVCAAASMLAQALVFALEGVTDINLDVRMQPGKLFVAAGATQTTEPMFRMCMVGLKALAEKYPKNISAKGEI